MATGLHPDAWAALIDDDPEVVQWARYGVQLRYNSLGPPTPYFSANYPSAFANKAVLDNDVASLLASGVIVGPLSPVATAHACVSPRAAIPKPNSAKWRIIIDPFGVNPFLDDLPLQLVTVRDVVDELMLLGPNAHMAKRDLENGFLQIPLAREFQHLFCFSWRGQVYQYTRLVFGGKQSPERFSRFTHAINRLFRRCGIRSRVYIDDFFFMASSRDACSRDLLLSSSLFERLGVAVNTAKDIGPTQVITFLGVTIDIPNQRVFIPPDKLAKLPPLLSLVCASTDVDWTFLSSLTGKLSHCASVSLSLRPFLKGFWSALYSLPAGHSAHARVPVSPSLREDAEWWLRFLNEWNGVSFWRYRRLSDDADCVIAMDASDTGFGALTNDGRALAGSWSPEQQLLSSTWREVFVTLVVFNVWGHTFSGSRLLFYTDNSSAAFIGNKGYSRAPPIHNLIRHIFKQAALADCSFRFIHVLREFNVFADYLSRFSSSATCRSAAAESAARPLGPRGEHPGFVWDRLEAVPGLLCAAPATSSAPFLRPPPREPDGLPRGPGGLFTDLDDRGVLPGHPCPPS